MVAFLDYNFLGDKYCLDPMPTSAVFDGGYYGNADFSNLILRKNYLQVKIDGMWKQVDEAYVKVDGIWKSMDELNIKIDNAIVEDKIFEI